MSTVRDFSRLGDNHLVTLVGAIALFAPGTGLMLVFQGHYFLELDILKILLLTSAIGLLTVVPVFLTVILKYSSALKESKEQSGIPVFVFSALLSAIVASAIQLLFWLCAWSFDAYLIVHAIVFYIVSPIIIAKLPAFASLLIGRN